MRPGRRRVRLPGGLSLSAPLTDFITVLRFLGNKKEHQVRSANNLLGRITMSLFTLLMAVAWSGWPRYAAAASATTSSAQDAARLDAIITAMEKEDRDAPHEAMELSAVVAEAGKDPAKLTAWVRNNIAWVAYQGSLRGAQGALLDRSGNSLDRSLLLAELLASVGIKARLAHGRIADPGPILESTRKAAPGAASRASSAPSEPDERLVQKVLASGSIDRQELKDAVAAAATQRQQFQKHVADRIAQQTAMLAKLVSPRQNQPSTAPDPEQTQRQCLADHWWAQVKSGNNWSDLDPLADVGAPQPLTTADETFEVRELPAKFLHQVTVSVVVEQLSQGRLTENRILRQELLPSQLVGETIELKHRPLGVSAPRSTMPSASDLRQTLTAVKKWAPVLTVGNKKIVQKAFTAGGSVTDASEDQVGGLGGALSGGFGVALGGGEASEKAGILTAEWLDFEIHSPGRPDLKVRRVIYDALGPAARAAGKTAQLQEDDARRYRAALSRMGTLQILPQVCRIPSGFERHVMVSRLAQSRKALVAYAGNPQDPRQRRSAVSALTRAMRPTYSLAATRFIAGDWVADVFIDRPNVLTWRLVLDISEDKDAPWGLQSRQEYDIVNNDLGVRAVSQASAWQARMSQGVADTVMEAAMLKLLGSPRNTAEMFAQCDALGRKPVVLTNRADGAADSTVKWLSPDVRHRAMEDLSAGYAIIVADQPTGEKTQADQSWWRVDPHSGSTLGVLSDGAHGSLTEYPLLVVAGEYGPVFLTVGDCLGAGLAFVCMLPFAAFFVWLVITGVDTASRPPSDQGRQGGVRG